MFGNPISWHLTVNLTPDYLDDELYGAPVFYRLGLCTYTHITKLYDNFYKFCASMSVYNVAYPARYIFQEIFPIFIRVISYMNEAESPRYLPHTILHLSILFICQYKIYNFLFRKSDAVIFDKKLFVDRLIDNSWFIFSSLRVMKKIYYLLKVHI